MLSKFIDFLIHWNSQIIQWLVISIIILSLYLAFIFLRRDRSSEGGRASLGEQGDEIKNMLKEVLASQPVGAAAAGGSAAASTGSGDGSGAGAEGSSGDANSEGVAMSEDASQLQKEVAAKEAVIQDLKAALGKGGGGGLDPETEAKLKDLEARLAEYQILEDDIADLSLFKEENEKLKAEIETLKSGGASAAPVEEAPETVSESPVESAEASAPATEESVAAGDDIVAEFEAAVEVEKSQPPTESEQALEAPEEDQKAAEAMESVLNEVPEGVAEEEPEQVASTDESSSSEEPQDADDQTAAEANTPEESPTTESPAHVASEEPESLEAKPEVSEEAPAEKKDYKAAAIEEEQASESDPVGDDLFAEFSQSLEENGASQGPELDTDAVLSELAGLDEAAQDFDGKNPLEEEIDTEKVAGEAGNLKT